MKPLDYQKLTDEQLLDSLVNMNTVLRSVVESPKNVIIFALDREYRYLVFNENHFQTMKAIWGAEISVGSCMLDYIKNSDDKVKAKVNFDRALAGESFIIEEEYGDSELERRFYEDIYNPIFGEKGNAIGLTLFLTDITERKRAETERDKLIIELKDALSKVKVLSGLIPICGFCRKIRDDKGYWSQLETYIEIHSDASFTHGLCPDCLKDQYPEQYEKMKRDGKV